MSLSSRLLVGTGVMVMAAGAALFAHGGYQAGDAAKVMADLKAALGGDKLAAVTTLTATGNAQRSMGDRSMGGEYELAIELPGKYFAKQVMAQTPMGNIARKAGFNGDALIEEIDQPQMPGGGRMMVSFGGPSGPNASPEQQAQASARSLASAKAEYTRMALGMFGAGLASQALEYSYGGVAEAPDGKADVINVKGAGDFAGKLFVDQKTHLPLMFSWMDKEPMQISTNTTQGRGGAQQGVVQMNGSMSAADRDKLMADMQARMAEAEKNRKMVEFRMFYGDYKTVDGVKLPHHFQQAMGNEPSYEITIDKYKVNQKIDPKKFEPKK